MNTTQEIIMTTATAYLVVPPERKTSIRAIPLIATIAAHIVVVAVLGSGLIVHITANPDKPMEYINVPEQQIPVGPTERPQDIPTSLTIYQPAPVPFPDGVVIEADVIDSPPPVDESFTIRTDPTTTTLLASIAPKALRRGDPPYPDISRRLGEEGRVMLMITIAPNGQVIGAFVKESSGYKRLDQAAIEGVKTWLYKPAQRGGMSVSETIPVVIRFSLT
jgi:periplasmic protein TonB